MKGKLICGGTASENEHVSQHHTLPSVDCFSYPELYSHYKVHMTATFLYSKMGVVYFPEQKQRRGKEREEKEAEDGSKDPAGVCAPQNGISTLHPTALEWPHPGPARSNFLAAYFLPRIASLVLQPDIPGHQKDQSHTA